MDNLKGVGVALVTPFTHSGDVDYKGLEKLLSHTSERGVDYYVVMGTTGESPTMLRKEKIELLKFVKQNNPRKLPIVYGLGGNCTAALVNEFKSFEEEVDAFLSVSPAYNKPSQEGIARHYEMLAGASNHPIILYNVPGRTSSNIEAKTTLLLANHPNIIGIKEASGDLNQCKEIAEAKPDDFLLISGDDMKTFPMIKFGACGVISVIANALPKQFSLLIHNALKGDDIDSAALQKMQEFDNYIMQECNPSGVKAALKYFGICDSKLRLPLVEVSSALNVKIEKFLGDYK